ncbi:helix-turn-helix domain-containing protein [Serratia marcescens]|uniref:S24 family peptidase n=1 Tax=Serratia TaxID=613 RepID=UPI0013DA3372|nr:MULTISPECIES: S24 family peptidase [Serratia]MBH3005926.1 helix-turn-helix domain-containing protein [Serratia ureilytica]MCF1610072.1 helix-turn-helix domain-containing protein [Serratia marcescens]MDU7468769.1 S24 family peptidase [Serratia marcescens]WAZ00972.1 helix-turn-helix domain-containing protein [Serratia marcescens]HEJ7090199.1 helix-turn-helix domain-containing protein [Serratia marcescens]
MKTLGERFRWRREQLGLTQEDAVKEINRLLQGERRLTRVTISNIENGSQESMKDKVLLAVIQVLKCSAEWLVNNIGPIETAVNNDHLIRSKEELRLVPLLSWGDVKQFINTDSSASLQSSVMIPCPVPCNFGTFALEVKSEEMLPSFELGDVIFVDTKNTELCQGKYVIAVNLKDNQATLKQFQLIDNSEYLKSTNPDYPSEIKFTKIDDNILTIGRVISQVKKL